MGYVSRSSILQSGSSLPTTTTWSTTWDMTAYKDMGNYTITGALAIISNDAGSVAGGCTQAILIANGVNIPTIDGVSATTYGYSNVNGALNLLQLYRAGNAKLWSCGAYQGILISTPALPVITSVPVVSGAAVGTPLSFTSASATGNPIPTISYDVLVNGSVVATNATSGSYTPTLSGGSLVVRVTATNNLGSVQDNSTAVTIAAAATVPDAPTGLTVGTPTTTTQPLTWTAPVSNGGAALSDYVVQWSPAGANTWTTFADGTSTGTSTIVTGLSANTNYDYRVAAVNVVGTGAYSTTATGSTSAVTLLRMTGLTSVSESGTGPYTYTATGTGGCVGAPNKSLAAGTDGYFRGVIKAMPSAFCGIGFATTSAAGIYSTFKYLIYANLNLTGTGSYLFGLNGAAGGVINGTATVPQADDILEIRRVGASLTVVMARAATPTTWVTLHTIATGVDTGVLYPRAVMQAIGSALQITDDSGLS